MNENSDAYVPFYRRLNEIHWAFAIWVLVWGIATIANAVN